MVRIQGVNLVRFSGVTLLRIQGVTLTVFCIMDLYHAGQLSKESFSEHHDPVYDKQKQVEHSIMELQVEIDAIKVQSLDNNQVLHDAKNLHKQWKTFTKEEKKRIVETITKSIIVGEEDIDINLSYLPTLLAGSKKKLVRNPENQSFIKDYNYATHPQGFVASQRAHFIPLTYGSICF